MKSSGAEFLAIAAYEASVREVMTSPKPGLVDAEGSGCHDDMDCALFLKSARAIAPFWIRQARAGLSGAPPERAMELLRPAGAEMERAMLEAAGGVNTHKGLIYLMSLLVYGAGFAIFSGAPLSAETAARFAALAVRGSVERELGVLRGASQRRALTNGERLYLEHGVTGVRGEAERGFPSAICAGLPALRRALGGGASFNDAGLAALLEMMLVCEDSNVIHRAGFDYWRGGYMELVRRARAAFRAPSWDRAPLYELERRFMERRVSPGGAADLLSCVYFLHSISDARTLSVVNKRTI
ncbi:triphosphoribosyl-dephospho-CoA synthase [Cloacibacillus sp. An23]|uniref:triphosphoribosyl-dephospho-CoA synthase n=1 Tax=Cloacibacillus sp. An23 TaxID=1965591 RepID=UPI000B384506|nr:triphosphoribosyl-dephospho-CoA synthase [Cloacibacillus sp. An23]OUO93986.1 triphosphoribosyl-dephospho-CoA synthase [Cloacibacillus sp. An23]